MAQLLRRRVIMMDGVKEDRPVYFTTYHLMHGDRTVASIDTRGRCTIFTPDFLPYSLYLEDNMEDFDTLFNNLTNFYFWCASRVLTLDRTYAKEILNSIGATQASTDKERAQIALSYHCLSLMDIYWVKEQSETISFHEINLFENHLDNTFADVSLRGKQMTIQNQHLIADDLSTNGSFPKAWIRKGGDFYLFKDGGNYAVENEILASRICQCFRCNQVIYTQDSFEGLPVSSSKLMTSLEYSIVSKEAFDIFAINQDMNAMEYILDLDGYSYYMMNILDYLVGNTDRHWGNWGLLIRNADNQPVRLHDLMDFNKALSAYDTVEGANCLTVSPEHPQNQMQAALEAVKHVGLNQTQEVKEEWFQGRPELYEMFQTRLEILKNN